MPKRNLIYLIIVAAVAAGAVWSVNYVESRRRAEQTELQTIRDTLGHLESEVFAWRVLNAKEQDLKKLTRLMKRGGQQYKLKPAERKKVTEGAIKGMVEALRGVTGDPYLRYVPRDKIAAFDGRIRGFDRGLGLQVKVRGSAAIVSGVLGGSPSHHAGLVPGDRIIAINRTDVADMEVAEVKRYFRGFSDGTVTLTVLRDRIVRTGGVAETIKVSAGEFAVQTVEGLCRDEQGQWIYQVDADSGIYYLRITEFVEKTKEQFQGAMRRLTVPRGLVLDLRDNPGGVPESAAAVANLFLSEGRIFTIINIRDDKPREKPFLAHKDGTYPADIRIVVLIDGDTSSAAEIVAGALRVHGRAVLIGSRTRGKTRVQDMIQISGMGLIVMSTGRFYLGRTKEGDSAGCSFEYIDADAPVKIDDNVQERLSRLRAMAKALPGKPPFKSPASPAAASLAGELQRLDAQLARAVALLKDPKKFEKILRSECSWTKADHE